VCSGLKFEIALYYQACQNTISRSFTQANIGKQPGNSCNTVQMTRRQEIKEAAVGRWQTPIETTQNKKLV
jgi:hypothetical protein